MLHRRNMQIAAFAVTSSISVFGLTISANADSASYSYGPGLTIQGSSRRPIVIGRVIAIGMAERQTTGDDWVALNYNVAGYAASLNEFEWLNDGPNCNGAWYLSPDNGSGLPSVGRIISSETPASNVGGVKSGMLIYPAKLKVITVHGQFIGPYPLTNPVCNTVQTTYDRIAGTARTDILPTITLPIVVK
jgi:hypothetical protein